MRIDARPWIVAALVLLVLFMARQQLAPFVIAAVVAYIFTPTVDAIQSRFRIRRGFAVGILYLLGLVVAAGLIAAVERPFIRETRALLREGPTIIDGLLAQVLGARSVFLFGQLVTVDELTASLGLAIGQSIRQPQQALHLAEGLFQIVLGLILCLITTFYLLLDGRQLGPYLLRFFPAERRPDIVRVANGIHAVLGRYLRGLVFLIALMSVVTYVCLTVFFGLHYALPIAVASGFLEIIPYVGPALAASIAAGVGFAQGGVGLAAGVFVLYLVLRQLEDQLVMPLVIGRAVHLHPVVTLFAIIVGEAVAGILGMLLAVPITAAAKVALDYVYPSDVSENVERPRADVPVGPRQDLTEGR
jgi:predicted PurR-regulated permease PerM